MIRRGLAPWLLAPLLLQAGARFDPVKDVPVSLAGGVLTLTLPRGVHLKARVFRVVLLSGGTLRLGALPPATEQDEVGDPIWRGTVAVELKGRALEDPVRLEIRYQPCTEGPDGTCFLPQARAFRASKAEIPTEVP